jgi:hypothetical protein
VSAPSTTLKWLGITAILAVGLIHLGEARSSFGDATYKGLLFVANGVGALAAAVGIRHGRAWGWLLGLLVAGGAFIGYVVSRTVGLPGLAPEADAWLEPAGVASLVLEALYVVLFVFARRRSSSTSRGRPTGARTSSR